MKPPLDSRRQLSAKEKLTQSLSHRILVLDGGLGTMIQEYNLAEQDYRGERFASVAKEQKGNNDLLNLTRPDIIRAIHRKYLEAGADIITTNTFSANAVSMEDYGMQAYVKEINAAAGQLARKEADACMAQNPSRTVFVAGSIGPTNKTASVGPDVNDPAFRSVTYKDLYHAYREQIEGLVQGGGVDALLFETIFDTLNLKAGLDAARHVQENNGGPQLPVMLSFTLSGQGGRTFSGQTLKAALASVSHADIISVGLNCSFGAADMLPYIRELAACAPFYVSAHPNAGLPNTFGAYDQTPDLMAAHVEPFIREGLVNIIGGCCGTTPHHIARYPALVQNTVPRVPVKRPENLWLSGLELLEITPQSEFISIGERCNVAGSRKFLRLIKEERYEEALSIARKQVEDGAQVIDINMDDGMLDAARQMTVFLNLIASEPDVARVPIMIDSSQWSVIEQALMCVQGKSIVNSISLKEGEAIFLQRAARIRQLGAAVVVMAFDETGQAETFERKRDICSRAYRLLTQKTGFPPQDIIFDPNILAVATGIDEHNGYGLSFIQATEWIKKNLPGARISGGVSNLSFAFRGNNYLREAMHAVFLHHAVAHGMDMGIVNPSARMLYDAVEPSLRSLLEDVILARRPQAAEELITRAQQEQVAQDGTKEDKPQLWRTLPLEQRLEYALVKGVADCLEEDLNLALQKYPRAVDIIDGPLMAGMNKVGELFGAGKMFLPQVVKTARTMKRAVAVLQPVIEVQKAAAGPTHAGKVIFATVKGDVHDIGKNIVSIVLSCNNYRVIDLGVMVPAETIVQACIKEQPDLLCLSGLITPSLEEMAHVVGQMQKAGLAVPVMIGGATTSRLHTAVKIAPLYSHPVLHVADASQNPLLASSLLNPETSARFVEKLREEQAALRAQWEKEQIRLVALSYARSFPDRADWDNYHPTAPLRSGVQTIPSIPVEELIPYINWTYFFHAWGLNGRWAEQFSGQNAGSDCPPLLAEELPDTDNDKAAQAAGLYRDAVAMLADLARSGEACCKARYGIFPANSSGDTLLLNNIPFPVLRQQTLQEDNCYRSLADYVMPQEKQRTDYVGAFVVTASAPIGYLSRTPQDGHDTFRQMLLQTLTDRMAEAAAEYLHLKVRTDYWGYAPKENLSIPDIFKARYRGVRPAVGYPSLPDQKLNFVLNQLLDMSQVGVELTDNGAMAPASSVSGLFIAHPSARHFMVGKIDEEQLADYSRRRGLSVEQIRPLLGKNV